jgi:hypothetical protein
MSEADRAELIRDVKKLLRHHPELQEFLENPNLKDRFIETTPYSQRGRKRIKHANLTKN